MDLKPDCCALGYRFAHRVEFASDLQAPVTAGDVDWGLLVVIVCDRHVVSLTFVQRASRSRAVTNASPL